MIARPAVKQNKSSRSASHVHRGLSRPFRALLRERSKRKLWATSSRCACYSRVVGDGSRSKAGAGRCSEDRAAGGAAGAVRASLDRSPAPAAHPLEDGSAVLLERSTSSHLSSERLGPRVRHSHPGEARHRPGRFRASQRQPRKPGRPSALARRAHLACTPARGRVPWSGSRRCRPGDEAILALSV